MTSTGTKRVFSSVFDCQPKDLIISRSGCGSLAHRKHLFNVSYKAQNSTQDDTANQFNDAGEVLDNPFIVEDNKGTESKEHNLKNGTNNDNNITENRLEANDERKNLDNVDNDHSNTSEMAQIIEIVEKFNFTSIHIEKIQTFETAKKFRGQ